MTTARFSDKSRIRLYSEECVRIMPVDVKDRQWHKIVSPYSRLALTRLC